MEPIVFAKIAGGALVGTALVTVAGPPALALVGFTPGGVVGGSVAALWQSTMGGIVTGTFSTCQSMGVLGVTKAVMGVGAVAGGAVEGATGVISNTVSGAVDAITGLGA